MRVLITDLDNTLFDWVGIWHASFSAMLDEIVAKSGLPREQLISEFHQVHQKHGTAEYAFSIEELPSLLAKHPGENLAKVYDSSIHKYRSARKKTLALYDGVLSTLLEAKRKGTLIIGYTESMAFYTMFRMKRLGLDGVFDVLYSPPDHDLPMNMTVDQKGRMTADRYELVHTEHQHTPKGELKPNPKILLQILKDVGARPDETVYVGDSLMKDVSMAQDAKAIDVFAAYGESKDRPEYELLRAVTHWTAADVERERLLKRDDVKPRYVLNSSFNELLKYFDFKRFIRPISKFEKEYIDAVLESWKKTVDVQMHFNDIEMRIRNYALTGMVAILGLTGVAVQRDLRLLLFGFDVPGALLIVIVAFFAWIAFYFMDKHWYHPLLIGAVRQGEYIEQRLRNILPEVALAKSIRESSPVKLFGITLRSDDKIRVFYTLIGALLLLLGLGFATDIHSTGLPIANGGGH